MKKVKKETNKGITLIALVITIIVLLILAGVTIATLTGENGILSRANSAKIENKGAAVQEARDLWFSEKKIKKYSQDLEVKELSDFLDELKERGTITQEDKDTIMNSEDCSIQIGSRKITFRTLVEDFEQGKIEAGDVINYKALSGESYTSYQNKNGCKDQVFESNSEIV